MSFARAYVNGCYCDLEQAQVPVSDRGFLYGDSLFETLRTYNSRPFLLEEHLQRLISSCQALGYSDNICPGELELVVNELCKQSDCELYLRLTVSRGQGFGPLPSEDNAEPSIVIVARQLQGYADELYQRGLRLKTADVKRPCQDLLTRHKTGNYLPFVMARIQAHAAGADEALLLNSAGRVAELSAANIFAISGNDLLTPAIDEGVLPGVTRKVVLQLASELGMELTECQLPLADFMAADELLATNSILELCRISEIDGQTVGSAGATPDTKLGLLQSAYRAEVLRRCP